MSTNPPPDRFRMRLLLAPVCLLLANAPAWSQQAAAPTASELAKYDTNKNGKLDPAEVAVMQAESAKAAAATDADGTVRLSPFSVSTDKDSGYYAQNTLSGALCGAAERSHTRFLITNATVGPFFEPSSF